MNLALFMGAFYVAFSGACPSGALTIEREQYRYKLSGTVPRAGVGRGSVGRGCLISLADIMGAIDVVGHADRAGRELGESLARAAL